MSSTCFIRLSCLIDLSVCDFILCMGYNIDFLRYVVLILLIDSLIIFIILKLQLFTPWSMAYEL